jgi:hypothetical protein
LSCDGNRQFWNNVRINQAHRDLAAQQFKQNVPKFNSAQFLEFLKKDRGPIDDMMYAGFKKFWSMILVGCADNTASTTYKNKISEYLTELVSWPSWADVSDDSGFNLYYDPNGVVTNSVDQRKMSNETYVYFKQKQFYVDLFACKYTLKSKLCLKLHF